jgi:hypothetical protein
MAHTPIARPCQAASGCGWDTPVRMALAEPAVGPMTRGGRRTAASRRAKRSGWGQPELQDCRVAPEGADLRRCWRCLSRCDPVRGSRRRWEDCSRPRQDRLPGLRRGFWRCFD